MDNRIQAVMKRGDIYTDNGCHLAPSCLNCPFPVCYLDDPITVNLHIVRLKERELVAETESMTSAVAARKLDVSERTYFRMVRRVQDYFHPQVERKYE